MTSRLENALAALAQEQPEAADKFRSAIGTFMVIERRTDAMISVKKTSQFQCDVDADGGMYDILDEIAALLEMIHRNCQEQDPDMANKFRTYVQEMTRDGSMVWSSDGSVPADTTAAHYERLCQAAEHFGLETQKWKAKER